MEAEALASRPESPKKKIKSSPVVDSEAHSSNSSDNSRNVDYNGAHTDELMRNGLALAPSRKGRKTTIPDSSSEISASQPSENAHTENSTPRVQEEEVSSSENSVGKAKEPEDLTLVCDSASLDSTSDSNGKK